MSFSNDDAIALRARLRTLADEPYRKFHSGLLPGVNNVLGVRMPRLRALARELSRGDWQGFLACTGNDSHEETMLRGLVIARVPLEFEEHCALVAQFVPSITDWALCDAFCSDIKFLQERPEEGFDFLCGFLQSERDYDLRFAVVGLLDHFTDAQHIDRLMTCYGAVKHNDYYVKIAVAWAISTACADFMPQVFALLESSALDDFTRRKAVSKICDSLRVSETDKKRARALRR